MAAFMNQSRQAVGARTTKTKSIHGHQPSVWPSLARLLLIFKLMQPAQFTFISSPIVPAEIQGLSASGDRGTPFSMAPPGFLAPANTSPALSSLPQRRSLHNSGPDAPPNHPSPSTPGSDACFSRWADNRPTLAVSMRSSLLRVGSGS